MTVSKTVAYRLRNSHEIAALVKNPSFSYGVLARRSSTLSAKDPWFTIEIFKLFTREPTRDDPRPYNLIGGHANQASWQVLVRGHRWWQHRRLRTIVRSVAKNLDKLGGSGIGPIDAIEKILPRSPSPKLRDVVSPREATEAGDALYDRLNSLGLRRKAEQAAQLRHQEQAYERSVEEMRSTRSVGNLESIGLLDPRRASWNDIDVPLHERGVRLGWLRDFVGRCLPTTMVHPSRAEPAMHELMEQHIKPVTNSLRAPLYALVPMHERGKPTAFLSYSWNNPVLSGQSLYQCGTLDAFGNRRQGRADIDDEFVWMDVVCYNQYTLKSAAIGVDMEKVISSIGRMYIAVTPTPLFDRLWCLWELLASLKHRCKIEFCLAPLNGRTENRIMSNDFFQAFDGFENARATVAGDYRLLLDAILRDYGSIRAADDHVRQLLRGELIEIYPEKVDLFNERWQIGPQGSSSRSSGYVAASEPVKSDDATVANEQLDSAEDYITRAEEYEKVENSSEAMRHYRQALSIYKKDGSNRRDVILADLFQRIGALQRKAGDLNGALQSYKAGADCAEAAANSDNKHRSTCAIFHRQIARTHVSLGNLDDALLAFRTCLRMLESARSISPTDREGIEHDVGTVSVEIGDILLDQGKLVLALAGC